MYHSKRIMALAGIALLVHLFPATATSQVAPETAMWRSRQHAGEAGRAAQWADYLARQAVQNPHRPEYSALAWQWKAYETHQQQWASYYQQCYMAAAQAQKASITGASRSSQVITMSDGYAFGLNTLPGVLHRIIEAANRLQDKPYILGGGHRRLEDVGYDCSGSVSYVLIKAGLLHEVLNSARMEDYGQPGPGRYVTIWVKPGHHVFMTICGLRLDTSGGSVAEGPRWRTTARSVQGFTPRHPPGL